MESGHAGAARTLPGAEASNAPLRVTCSSQPDSCRQENHERHSSARLARPDFRSPARPRHPAGLSRPRCRPCPADRGLPAIPVHPHRGADDGRRRRGARRRRVAGRPALGAAHAKLGGGQHHQHAGPDEDAALSVPDTDHHARRVGRVQFLAVPDGPGHAQGARGDGPAGLPGRGGGRRQADGRCGGARGVQWRPGGRRAAAPEAHRHQDFRGEIRCASPLQSRCSSAGRWSNSS